MQPLKQEYIRNQTDEVLQAKAAYDQLNEQLTSELPQLIDLRYVLSLCHPTLCRLQSRIPFRPRPLTLNPICTLHRH